MLVAAGHNRSDVLKALRKLYLLSAGDYNVDDELRRLTRNIDNRQHEALFG